VRIPIYQIDAFTDRLFRGNPAAVCVLERWLPDEQLTAIAGENNVSETAFLVPQEGCYELRWFTPTVEVDLCGHATLAAGWAVLHRLEPGREAVRFLTRSGDLTVQRRDDWLEMDFPARPAEPAQPPPGLVDALGPAPRELWKARDYMAVYEAEEQVRELQPDMAALSRVEMFALIVTAPGREVDFVSRFFAPAVGVPEDPVTGSAHCTLTPYWAQRLAKSVLRARQLSRRGGELVCELRGERVMLRGQAVLYLEGYSYV